MATQQQQEAQQGLEAALSGLSIQRKLLYVDGLNFAGDCFFKSANHWHVQEAEDKVMMLESRAALDTQQGGSLASKLALPDRQIAAELRIGACH